METVMARKMRQIDLNNHQIDLVIGSLLGDGHLVKTTSGYAFRVNHGLAQKEYVRWKYEIIKPFVRSSPKECGSCCYFRTITHPSFIDMRRLWYEERVKQIPGEMLEKHFNAFVVAVWIMDDGSRDGKQLRINSQCFTRSENELLQRFLWAKLGITSTLNRDKGKYRIRIAEAGMSTLISMIRPHIIPNMLYKLPL